MKRKYSIATSSRKKYITDDSRKQEISKNTVLKFYASERGKFCVGNICVQAVSSYKDYSFIFLKCKSWKQTYSAKLEVLCKINTLMPPNLYLSILSEVKQKGENHSRKSSGSLGKCPRKFKLNYKIQSWN